tara:strand:+ start:68 stop:553 length:486 start_codon:yes stop_codon:yes gene_type:complete
MKTYKQFTQDLEENVLNKNFDKIKNTVVKNYNRIPKPVRTNLRRFGSGLFRLNYADDAIRNPNKDDVLTRATNLIGVAKPFSGPALFGSEIINQAKPNSTLNKAVNFIGKQQNKVPLLPYSGKRKITNKTDLGKRIGDFLGFNKKDTYGASDLKGTSSGMS